jgi:hypothetical protein
MVSMIMRSVWIFIVILSPKKEKRGDNDQIWTKCRICVFKNISALQFIKWSIIAPKLNDTVPVKVNS